MFGWMALGDVLLGSFFPNYVASNAITGILLVALLPWGLASLVSYSLIAADKEGLVARAFLVGMAFHIVLNVVLISLKGAEGAAWARVATEVLIASLLCLFAIRSRDRGRGGLEAGN
jgi:O-antigen/teichoic acid export membrane protein